MRERATRHRARGGTAALVAVLVLAGCASTPDAPPDADGEFVTLADVAADLGLTVHHDARYGRVLLEAPGGDRISARAGGRTLTIRGVRYEASAPLVENDDALWINEDDARTIRGMWNAGSRAPFVHIPMPAPAPPSPDYLTVDDLPEVPTDPPPAVPAPPRGVNVPTVAERAAWAVPLRRSWDYVVMHHSASASGNASIFHKAHLANGWDGLGYHFVIGNGRGSRDGQIEVGWRWRKQREGAHAGNDVMNQRGIGICLVGDFTKTRPTAAQMRSLQRLSNFLSAYCGIPSSHLRYHRDVRDPSRGATLCPGKYFPTSFRFHPLTGVTRGAAYVYGTR